MTIIKAYTDLEQSKVLSNILPFESVDMWYSIVDDEAFICLEHHNEYEQIPCWSLASLLNIIPYPQLFKDKVGGGKVGWMVSAYPNDCRYDSCWHDNPIDACVNIIERLHELKML